MLKYREVKYVYADIWRVFISGSSEAGKTFFARQLLEKNFFKYERIYYYHPDIQEQFPVDWKKHLKKPILFQAGLPTEDDLLQMPQYSCIILDDLFTQACSQRNIDYLFRVLSSKKKLHVIIMTQRYFAEGNIGRNIRNSSNYHVLMTNADERTNMRVGSTMNLNKEIAKAVEINKNKLYPYIFVDKTKFGRVSGLQIFTDIFSRHKEVICNSMPFYVISENDFKINFKILGDGVAQRNVDAIKENSTKEYTSDTSDSSSDSTEFDSDSGYSKYVKRKKLERKIGAVIQRRKVSAKL